MYNFYFFLVKLIVIFNIILIWSRRRRWLCSFCHLEETNQCQYYVQHISCQSVPGAMKLRAFLIFSKLGEIYIQMERKREYIFKCCSFVFALSIKMMHDFSPLENNILKMNWTLKLNFPHISMTGRIDCKYYLCHIFLFVV